MTINFVPFGHFQLNFILVKEPNPNRLSSYEKYFNELNFDLFIFSFQFECSDIYEFRKVITLFKNFFNLRFYPVRNEWKHKLNLIEISKNNSEKVIDLMICKNLCIPIKEVTCVFRYENIFKMF